MVRTIGFNCRVSGSCWEQKKLPPKTNEYPPSLIKPGTPGRERERSDQPMYQAFLQFSRDVAKIGKWDAVEQMRKEEVVQEAIISFGKTGEYETLKRDKENRLRIQAALDGTDIMAWTGVERAQTEILL